ncbi:hypothetical protein Enr10x_24970 [Gimesia panareensis]|uniref:Uncharacterized protein n=1 Tax=Gimesia panareensis TaxID=2527978 RepID=A0A517Q6C9_9PLAN|nr:hypothetical protein Enr10x_24970 [Gimesia panareensis]QDU49968.1 hypothetical protein Pan110_23090 [Gimesia panareensis]
MFAYRLTTWFLSQGMSVDRAAPALVAEPVEGFRHILPPLLPSLPTCALQHQKASTRP